LKLETFYEIESCLTVSIFPALANLVLEYFTLDFVPTSPRQPDREEDDLLFCLRQTVDLAVDIEPVGITIDLGVRFAVQLSHLRIRLPSEAAKRLFWHLQGSVEGTVFTSVGFQLRYSSPLRPDPQARMMPSSLHHTVWELIPSSQFYRFLRLQYYSIDTTTMPAVLFLRYVGLFGSVSAAQSPLS
jgi:hypothetical protein